jgi:hypothetical protein
MSHKKERFLPASGKGRRVQVVQTNMRGEAQITPEAGSPKIAMFQGFSGEPQPASGQK